MKKFFYTLLVAAGITTLSFVPCMAGEMNGEESRVYSAASGSFTYSGETYYANSEYLAQLSAYLCRDDVDLTAAQADSAIRSMGRKTNIKKAIDRGYISKAGGNGDNQPSTESEGTPGGGQTPSTEGAGAQDTERNTEDGKKPNTERDTQNGGGSKGDKEQDNGKPGNAGDAELGNTEKGGNAGGNAAGNAGNTKEFDSAGQAEESYLNEEEKQEREEILATRPQKDEAENGEITYDTINNQIIFSGSKNQKIVIPNAFRYIKGTHTRSMFTVVELILLGVTVISLGVLFAFRCFSFQKKRHKLSYSNHKRRRILRKVFGAVLVAVLAVNIFVTAAGIGVQLGLFQSSRITDMLSASGYYHESFNEMQEEIYEIMEENGCPQNACDSVVTYDRYLFATRNHVQMTLKGLKPSAEYTDISSEVKEALEGVLYLTDETKEELGEAVHGLYQQSVKNIIGETLYGIKQIFLNVFRVNMVIAVIDILLCIFVLLFMDHYKHRAMKKIAASLLGASLLICTVAAVILIGKPYTSLYIEPDYLYLFAVEYIRWVTKVFAVLAAVGALAAFFVWMAGKGMKRTMQEK